jgi:hypothetical protein
MSHNAEVRQVKSLEDAPSTIITNSITGHRKLRIDHHCYASSSLERTTDFRSCRNENCFLFYLGPSRRSAELRPLHPLTYVLHGNKSQLQMELYVGDGQSTDHILRSQLKLQRPTTSQYTLEFYTTNSPLLLYCRYPNISALLLHQHIRC